MSSRKHNHRLVKIHRNYTVEEAAELLGVHKNTIREWIRRGLETIDERRPMLILGHVLTDYLIKRRKANKRPCKAGEIYCVRCRCPQNPAGGMADYQPLTPTSGNLIGLCPACDTIIYRRTNYARLVEASGQLNVRLPKAQQHIDDSCPSSVNSDFNKER